MCIQVFSFSFVYEILKRKTTYNIYDKPGHYFIFDLISATSHYYLSIVLITSH